MSTRELLPPPSALKLYNRDMRKLHGDNFQPFSDLKDIKLKNKYMEMAAEKAQKPHYKRPPSAFNLFIGDYMETHKHDNNLQKDKDNLLYINNKLKYENTLKELILNKNFKDKKCIIEKLKKYHLGYIVWKSLLHESVEDLDLELYLIE